MSSRWSMSSPPPFSIFSPSKHLPMLTFDGLTVSVAASVSARCEAALPLHHEGQAYATHPPQPTSSPDFDGREAKIPCGFCLRIRPPAASSNYQPRKNDRVKQAIRFLAVRSDHGSIGHRRPPIAVHARREKTPHRSQARPEPAVSAENLKGAIAATLLFRARRLTVARKREVDDSRERELRGSTLDTVIGGRPIEAQART